MVAAAPAAHDAPAGQRVHVLRPAKAAYEPAGHGVQRDEYAVENEPAEHVAHTALVPAAYVPPLQKYAEVKSALLQDNPIGHARHEEAPIPGE